MTGRRGDAGRSEELVQSTLGSPQPPIQPNPTLLTVQNIWKIVHFHAVGLPLSPQSHPSNSLEHFPLHIGPFSQIHPTKSRIWYPAVDVLASVEAQLEALLKNVDLWRRWELPLADFKSLATLRGNNGRPMKKLQIKQFFGRFWQLSRKLPESKRALLKLLLTSRQQGNLHWANEATRRKLMPDRGLDRIWILRGDDLL